VKLQSTAFIVDEIERFDGNTKAGAFGERPFRHVSSSCDCCCCGCDDDDSEVVDRSDYEALLALAVELAERVKDGRLRPRGAP
jgi:hypothetical protein